MFGGIIWIIVVACICYRVYKQRMGNPPENNQRGRTPNLQGQIQTSQRQRTIQARPFVQPSQAKQAPQAKPLVQPARAKQMPQAMAQRQPAESQTKSENEPESTLAYLEEKARKDAMEHEMEKREEARRLYESSGGLRPAQRLYEGDGVPNGCKCVACGYCAAENLVPVSSRERFSCYFCREPLDT